MASLPNVSTIVEADAEEGEFKTWLAALYAYLSGQFGTTGEVDDARAALGITPLTLDNILSALGYTPADAAAAATDHNHTGTYSPMTAFVAGMRYSNFDGSSGITFTRANGTTVNVELSPPDSGGGD